MNFGGNGSDEADELEISNKVWAVPSLKMEEQSISNNPSDITRWKKMVLCVPLFIRVSAPTLFVSGASLCTDLRFGSIRLRVRIPSTSRSLRVSCTTLPVPRCNPGPFILSPSTWRLTWCKLPSRLSLLVLLLRMILQQFHRVVNRRVTTPIPSTKPTLSPHCNCNEGKHRVVRDSTGCRIYAGWTNKWRSQYDSAKHVADRKSVV